MAGLAPDATARLDLTAPAANDNALRTLLGSAAGKEFRVGPQHVLAKSAAATPIYIGATGSDVRLSWPAVDWLIGRAVDITALAALNASWLFRPAFTGQV
jgi:hypothetical protein